MQNTLTVTSAAGAPCGVWGSTYMVWLMRPDNRTLGGHGRIKAAHIAGSIGEGIDGRLEAADVAAR